MARQRLVRPEFFRHADLYDAETASGLPLRLAFAGLWTVADRRGLFIWKPRELKIEVLPHDAVDFAAVLSALESYGFLFRYVVDGKEYGCIPSFERHQSFNKREQPDKRIPAPPKNVPEPPRHRTSTVQAPDKHHTDTPGTGTGTGTGFRVVADTGPAPSWPATLAGTLTRIGPVSPGRIGRALKPFVDGLPPERRALLGKAAECYVRWYTNLTPDQARFEKHPKAFLDKPGHWLEQVRPLTPEEAEQIA
jgi:hypothetical protein